MTADAPKPPATIVAAGFSRVARLLKHSDFDRVYKQGRRHFSSHLTVFFLRRTDAVEDAALANDVVRVGFTVGRALGGAVDRNRIKRRLREAVRQRRSLLAGTGPADIVINPKKSVLTLDFSLVLQEVGQAFETISKKLARK